MIETDRLILRQWRDADREPWAALNADPEVMRYFPATLTGEQSDAAADGQIKLIAERGFGLWAIERQSDRAFLGFTGLMELGPELPIAPAVEIGWRLARHAWGHGYASEAARAALSFGFDRLGLPEIVSYTATTNLPSQAVMRRIGMTRAADRDFDHPKVPEGHQLRPHLVYVQAAQ